MTSPVKSPRRPPSPRCLALWAAAVSLGGPGAARAAPPCPPPPPTACAARAYAAPARVGAAACLAAPGAYGAAALAAAGLPEGQLRSIEVAPGYEARLVGDGEEAADAPLVRGAVDRFALAGAAGAYRAVRVQARRHCGGRPQVYMAMHGSNVLARPEHDGAWAQVRAGLDGIWGNDAYIGPSQQAAIYRKVATRRIIQEQDHDGADSRWVPVGVYAGLQRQNPDIVLDREAMAVHKSCAGCWNEGDVDGLRRAYVAAPGVAPRYLFRQIYTGWQPSMWHAVAAGTAALPAAAQDAFDAGGGAFVECGARSCRGADRRALRHVIGAAHARGQRFVWFNGTPQGDPTVDAEAFVQATQGLYNELTSDGLLGPDDVVMVINYFGRMAALPEADAAGRPAATATGLLLWLLQQP